MKQREKAVVQDDVTVAIDLWNNACPDWGAKPAQLLTSSRRAALAERLRDAGGLDGWRHAIDLVREADCLTGRTPGRYRADLAFMLKPDNFAKLMEEGFTETFGRKGGGIAALAAQMMDDAALGKFPVSFEIDEDIPF